MDQYFDRMAMLAENQELPLRIRFMLRDSIELRRNRWVPRKATNMEGPMPIQQVCIKHIRLLLKELSW
jgi:translation initiation factor 4G